MTNLLFVFIFLLYQFSYANDLILSYSPFLTIKESGEASFSQTDKNTGEESHGFFKSDDSEPILNSQYFELAYLKQLHKNIFIGGGINYIEKSNSYILNVSPLSVPFILRLELLNKNRNKFNIFTNLKIGPSFGISDNFDSNTKLKNSNIGFYLSITYGFEINKYLFEFGLANCFHSAIYKETRETDNLKREMQDDLKLKKSSGFMKFGYRFDL